MHSNDANGLPDPLEVCRNLVGFIKDRLSYLQTHLTHGKHVRMTPWGAPRSDRADRRQKSLHIAESPAQQSANLVADQRSSLSGQHPISTVTKEDLGRATWLLLHTIAAQYPARPSRQHRKDVAALIDTLTRIYPCGECADHFREIVRSNAPATSSAEELQQWACEVHNCVNRSLGKPDFNCKLVHARWNGLDCGTDMACDMASGSFRPRPFS